MDLFYLISLGLASPLLLGVKLFQPKEWEKISLKFSQNLPESPPKKTTRMWIHGASLGEVRLALRIQEELSKLQPDLEFILTCNRAPALELIQGKGFTSFILPFDFSWAIKKVIKKYQPDHLILIETELWPNLINEMAKIGSVSMANGRLSEKHMGNYRRFGFLLKPLLQKMALIQAGDPKSEERFLSLGVKPEQLAFEGNFKFTTTKESDPKELEVIKAEYAIAEDDFLVVAGSIQPEEIPTILAAFKKLEDPKARLVLIPRHAEKKEACLQVLQNQGFKGELLPATKPRLILIDRFGVLTKWYQLASLVFVGGSFAHRGGQNMIEPASLGKAVAVGPFYKNFTKEVEILSAAKAIEITKDEAALSNFFLAMHENDAERTAQGERAKKCVRDNAGATVSFCKKIILQIN